MLTRITVVVLQIVGEKEVPDLIVPYWTKLMPDWKLQHSYYVRVISSYLIQLTLGQE